MPHRLTPGRSSSVSTGSRRPPSGQDIHCGIDLPIVHGSTDGADPLTDGQGQSVQHVSAAGTGLTGGKPPIDRDQCAPVPGGLVFEHRSQRQPRGIRDTPGQTVVLQHVPDGQILDDNHLVLADESSRQLVQGIPTPISDSGVHPGELTGCFCPVQRAHNLSRQDALSADEASPFPLFVLRASHFLAGRQRRQFGDAQVDANRGDGCRKLLDDGLDQDRYVPTPGRIPRHGDRGWLCARRQGTRPPDVQRLSHLCKRQPTIAPAETRTRVFRRRLAPLARLEPRVPRPFVEEIRERRLQVPQALLQRHRGHVGQEPKILTSLPLGQQRRGICIGHALLPIPRCGANLQGLVVHQTYAPKRAGQLSGLHCGRIEAVAICPLRHLCRHSPYYTKNSDSCRTDVRFPAGSRREPAPIWPGTTGVLRLEFL